MQAAFLTTIDNYLIPNSCTSRICLVGRIVCFADFFSLLLNFKIRLNSGNRVSSKIFRFADDERNHKKTEKLHVSTRVSSCLSFTILS